MSVEHETLHLPGYQDFVDGISVLSMYITASELHGTMCGYLCAGAHDQAESYLRALLNNKKDKASREALVHLFSVYSISQQQIDSFDFGFEMLLPPDETSIHERAEAFTEWCDGFIEGLELSGINSSSFEEEESQEVYFHITEFSKLDCDSLEISGEDEKPLVEICEYTRMAVLRLHSDLISKQPKHGGAGTAH